MKLQSYLKERMINKSPFILSNPSLPEVRNLLNKELYKSARGLYANTTKKLFIWNGGDAIHKFMFEYLIQNGFLPEQTQISDMKRVHVLLDYDDDGVEKIYIEVNQYKGARVMDENEGTKNVPQLKKLFPNAVEKRLE